MTCWTDLYDHFMHDPRAVAELVSHAWAYAANTGDEGLLTTLATSGNVFSARGICDTLDMRAYPPAPWVLEWAKMRDGAPPPVPFFVLR